MGRRADEFIIVFNRLEKWMRDQLGNPSSMGFSEMTRRLAKNKEVHVKIYEEDLLQMAQLRNAIVHEKIADNFIIAEPNDWAVNRIRTIEKEITQPRKVFPAFEKHVTGFELTVPLLDILSSIHRKAYSQFPVYQKGKFQGLITVHGLGLWLAKESGQETIKLSDKKLADVLLADRKKDNYHFVSKNMYVFEVETIFRTQPMLEAVFITKSGNSDESLLGIIRPKDLFLLE